MGRAGRRKRVHTPAEVVAWVAGVPVALAFLLLLARQTLPLAVLVFVLLAAFAWWEWSRT